MTDDGAGDAGGGFAPAIDVHVHLMPERLMAAIRDALHEEAGWEFPHPVDREGVESTLRAAGVDRYVALPYAHRAGVAADLNRWVLDSAAGSEMAIPFATVHGDDDVATVVRTAFEDGARVLKFQCPVHGSSPTDPRLDPAFELAAEYDRPVLFHAGTAPMFEGDPHIGADQFEAFLESYPDVRACYAHMGAYETAAFADLACRYVNAFLDTAYVLGEGARRDLGDELDTPAGVFDKLSTSIMFGSDFPNVTFPYTDCVDGFLDLDLTEGAREDLRRRTAERFLGER